MGGLAGLTTWVGLAILRGCRAELMTHAPTLFEVPILLALACWRLAFTRLVHFWSLPRVYLRRPPSQYQTRDRCRPRLLSNAATHDDDRRSAALCATIACAERESPVSWSRLDTRQHLYVWDATPSVSTLVRR